MGKNTRGGAEGLPQKPHPDFPLFPHRNGQWAKKVRGKLHYFGTWDNPQAALDRWLSEKDALLAGRRPREVSAGVDLKAALAKFLAAKQAAKERGDLSPRSLTDYESVCKRLAKAFGSGRLLDDIRQEDFAELRAGWPTTWGPKTIENAIIRVRSVFNWLYQSGLIEHPVRFGPGFNRPSARTLRLSKKGLRLFERDELLAVLTIADPQMKAMILLGVNAGLGNADCGRLRRDQIQGEWLDYPRPKTGLPRRCWLWPETLDALAAIKRMPRHEASGLVFMTRYGQPWHRDEADSPIAKEMAKLLKSAKVSRPGLNFYALRHTTETVGGEARDQPALDVIMGHASPGMAGVYRERVSDERIKHVSAHIRGWLFTQND